MSQGVATSYHEVVLTGELMVSDAVELRKRVFSSEGERKAFKAFQNSLGEATDARTKFARALCWWVIGTYDKVVECD